MARTPHRECTNHDTENRLEAEPIRTDWRAIVLACTGYVIGMLAVFNGTLPIATASGTAGLTVSLVGLLLAGFSALTLALSDHSTTERRRGVHTGPSAEIPW